MHRITSIAITARHHATDFPGIGHSACGLPWHEPQQHKIHANTAAANNVRERIWSEDQEIRELHDGSIVLTLTSQSRKELVAWANSFGGETEIVAGIKGGKIKKRVKKNRIL